jgi:hypothetical protein
MVVEEKWVGFLGNVVEMMVYGAIRPVGMERSFAYLPVGFAHLCSSFSQIVPKCKNAKACSGCPCEIISFLRFLLQASGSARARLTSNKIQESYLHVHIVLFNKIGVVDVAI